MGTGDHAQEQAGAFPAGTNGATLGERILMMPLALRDLTRPLEVLKRASTLLARELGARVTPRWRHERISESGADAFTVRVTERGEPAAELVIQRDRSLTTEEARLVGALGEFVSMQLDVLSKIDETRLIEELGTSLPSSGGLADAASRALRILIRYTEAEAGSVLLNEDTAVRPLAATRDWIHEPAVTREVLAAGVDAVARSHAHPQTLLACPIGSASPSRYLLLLRFPDRAPPRAARAASLRKVVHILAPHLDALRSGEVPEELLELHQAPTETTTRETYARILHAAIRLVPGSDSGTLLSRTSKDEPFVFQAAEGFDLEGLQRHPLSAEEVRAWYGTNHDGWARGRSRIIRRDRNDITDMGRTSTPQLDADAASYDDIHASLCLPVLHEGEVMAVLNLENQSSPDAFGRDSREVVHLFGPAIASLLNRQHTHDLLRHAALTDELTGLANRRAFDEAFERELARRERHGTSLSVLALDLTDFKSINDDFGHDAGDEVLKRVADVLRSCVRDTDMISRRGGDEFAAMLVGAKPDEVHCVATRLRQEVANIGIHGRNLSINVGLATADVDDAEGKELLMLADRRMYEDKARHPHRKRRAD